MELEGKVALVTGAGSGIGEACARRFVAAGARVIVSDLDLAAAVYVADSLGERARAHQADVGDPDGCAAAVREALDHFGALHVAVNNAGIPGVQAGIDQYPLDAWRRVMATDLDGVFFSMRAEIPAIVESGGGSIVNVASIVGVVGYPGFAAYVASKHGVIGLTRVAAIECATRGVRVNAVGPGMILTGITDHISDASDDAAGQDVHGEAQRFIDAHPMQRAGQPAEVAELVTFLASDASSFCTGGFHAIDGGYTAQ